MRMGMAIGIPQSPVAPGVIAPDQITGATLLGWFRTPESISMGGTLTSTGTTPPTVTLSSNDASFVHTDGVWVDIVVGGARGVATFDAGIDNPTRTTKLLTAATTAASVAMPGSNWSIVFANATYNADNLYQAIASLYLDKVGTYPTSTNNLGNSTAGTRPLVIPSGSLGTACIRYDGSDDRLFTTGSLGSSAYGGADKSFFFMGLFDIRALPSAGNTACIYSVSNTTDTDIPMVRLAMFGTGPTWRVQRRSDTGVATEAESVIGPSTGQALIEDSFDGTTRRLTVNGVDIIGGDSGVTANTNQSGKTITTTTFTIGCQNTQAGTSNFSNVDCYEFLVASTRPSDSVVFGLRNYFYS